jgi:hypothetical protein
MGDGMGGWSGVALEACEDTGLVAWWVMAQCCHEIRKPAQIRQEGSWND